MLQLLEPFPLPACSGSSEAARNLRFFVSSCSFPGLFLLQLHFVEFSFPLFLHFSLLAEIPPQLLWSHTFISDGLSWLAFCFHSYWLFLMGCVRLSFHPSHLHTYGERIKKKKKTKHSENQTRIIRINNLQSVLSTNISSYIQTTAF